LSLEEPSLKESLAAIETLYNLTLFHSHEPEFSDLFRTLSNVWSLLKSKQCNALKSSKITAYFQNAETEKKEAGDGEIDGKEVIIID